MRIFDYLLDAGFIYHYEYIGKVKESFPYPIDYSMFNFETNEFEGIYLKGREPFKNVELFDNFKPDYEDVRIIGKKQARSDIGLKELSSHLDTSFRDVLYHYQKHIAGKGLISSYITTIVKPHYRLHVIFGKKETLDYLTRIPTLYYVHSLDNHYVAHILGRRLELFRYIDFIKEVESTSNDNIIITLHPYNEKYIFTASIPYEHFTPEGNWEFNVEKMYSNAEKIVEEISQKNRND
ncbi:hypothetical protein DFR86_03720 [Acidianus sulfidivorans JP7]|uniref:Uncharacterized protein n=1 Tax=Acidianus sulfidivorans JP7 TaxID=619593 RepID=A0A2U9IL59_9CREN|nr:hypothetical protein [Acidianus sulfidivorans]AWR96750.1 hypothetical protein DFR86_03720 [Acidianus sulfidivorans JP7]